MKVIAAIIDYIRYILIGLFIGSGAVNVFNQVKAGESFKTIGLELLTAFAVCSIIYWICELLIWIFGGSKRR